MTQQTSQSIGKIRCEQELQENLFVGCIEFPEQQERRCVIHFLPAADDLGRRRFVREAMIGYDVSRDHRNLLSTLFFGVWDDGRLFIAVECAQGRAVSELTAQLRGRFEAIRAIGQQCLQALEFLHERGVAHGQVTGNNLLIGTDGVVRLGNFSRARRVRTGGDNDPAFQADLRALGELLFELVADIPLAQLRLFLDVQPGACLPAETTPELVVLIEQLLGNGGPVSASVALASLESAPRAPTGERDDPRRQLALLAGDLETAEEMLPPASEIDADIFPDDDDGDDSEEDLALLFSSVLSRLGGEQQDPQAHEPPTATAVAPPEPPPRRRNGPVLHAAVTALALLLAVLSLMRGPTPDRPPEPAQQAPDHGDADSQRLPLPLSDAVATSSEAALTGAAGSAEQRGEAGPRVGDAVQVDGIPPQTDGEAPRSDETHQANAPVGNGPGVSEDRAQSQSGADNNRSAFVHPTESSGADLRFGLDGGVVSSDSARFFGYLTNTSKSDLHIADLQLSGISERGKTRFSLEQRHDQCKSDNVISPGASCRFFFEGANLALKPGHSRLYLVARDRAGLRHAIITVSEEL